MAAAVTSPSDLVKSRMMVQPVDSAALVSGPPGEDSATVRARVVAARARQRDRLVGQPARCNAELSGDAVRHHTRPTAPALALLQELLDRRQLSARAGTRLLKLGRTIADLDGYEDVLPEHVLEASSWRLPLAGARR